MSSPIGGFMPIPLAMMIPFMATQSLVMGEAFGKAFQFGKRKISAMSNEEFNKLDIEQVASEMFASYKNIDTSLRKSIESSQDLQEFIVQQMLLILPKMIGSLLDAGTANIPRAQPIPPTGTGAVPRIPTPDTTAADVFKTTTQGKKETRDIWVIFKGQNNLGLQEPPSEAQVKSRAKQDLYLGAAPEQQRTLVVDKMTILQRTQSGPSNRFWNYQIRMEFHW